MAIDLEDLVGKLSAKETAELVGICLGFLSSEDKIRLILELFNPSELEELSARIDEPPEES